MLGRASPSLTHTFNLGAFSLHIAHTCFWWFAWATLQPCHAMAMSMFVLFSLFFTRMTEYTWRVFFWRDSLLFSTEKKTCFLLCFMHRAYIAMPCYGLFLNMLHTYTGCQSDMKACWEHAAAAAAMLCCMLPCWAQREIQHRRDTTESPTACPAFFSYISLREWCTHMPFVSFLPSFFLTWRHECFRGDMSIITLKT